MFKNTKTVGEIEVGSQTLIGEGVKLEGNFSGLGDVVVDGSVNGTLKTSGNIQIGHAATITAEVSGDSISIAGKVIGNIVAQESIRVTSSAVIEGDLTCSDLIIESGSKINGQLNMKGKAKSAPVVETNEE